MTSYLDRFFAEKVLKAANVHSEEMAEAIARLMHESRKGNLCVKKETLGDAAASFPPSIAVQGTDLFPKAPIVFNKGLYYLQKNWVYETYILEAITRLRKNPPPSYFDETLLEENLKEVSKELTPAQIAAIRAVLKQSLSLICGGPGTGKTYTAVHLVNLLFSSLKKGGKEDFYVSIAAPTGKAASHLQAALQAGGPLDPRLHINASTLHKLLKLQPGKSRLFTGGRIDADLIIIDEASMIDVSLLAHLLEAVGDETQLVLIGDPNQLPPIDACSLFSEIGKRFGISLERCMRTEDRELLTLSQAVRDGKAEEFFRLLAVDTEPISIEKLYEKISPIATTTEPDPKACFEKYGHFRILNPIRQTRYGTNALNSQILERLKKTGKWWAAPILAIANDSFSEIYNGMSGILIGEGRREEAAYFLDPFTKEMRRFLLPPPFELGFCMSIHKSQGSEFDEILALFPERSENFGREALYTAITRAKKRIEIQGSPETIEKMMQTTSGGMSGFSVRIGSLE